MATIRGEAYPAEIGVTIVYQFDEGSGSGDVIPNEVYMGVVDEISARPDASGVVLTHEPPFDLWPVALWGNALGGRRSLKLHARAVCAQRQC